MSASVVVRWGGLAAMVAGVSLLVAELLELLTGFGDEPFRVLALTSLFTFQQALYLLGLTLLSVGLVGLYAHQLEPAGPLGLVGFLTAFIGTVLFTGFFWANIFIAPALALGAPEFLDLGRLPGFFPSLLTYTVGWILFGLASLRSRIYPRVAVTAHSRRGTRPSRWPRAAFYRHRDRRGLCLAGLQPLFGKGSPGRADPARAR